MQTNVSDKLLQRGPELWCELHRWALSADRKDANRWLARFETRIGCGECRRHWQEILSKQPPEMASNETLFAWSVGVHNAVNRQLGKPEMTVEAARSYWNDRACREQNIARNAARGAGSTSGCRGCGGKSSVREQR